MTNKTYEWDDGYRRAGHVDAQQAGPVLEKLAERAQGQLTTGAVVEAAKPKRSPLHGGFEWDDSLAAAEHRSYQARKMVNSLRIVIVGEEAQEPQRLFLNVRYSGGHAYSTVDHILSDEELYQSVLDDAVGALKAWQKRYKEIKELRKVHEAIGQASRELRVIN